MNESSPDAEADTDAEPVLASELYNYRLGRCLGRGKFGAVYLIKSKETETKYALKVIDKVQCERNQVNPVKEFVVQRDVCEHKNIVDISTIFQDSYNTYIVFPYLPLGDLFEYSQLRFGARFDHYTALTYARQIRDGLAYCHSNGFIHNDIKPENILMISETHVAISDFGWAVPIGEARKICVGTLQYLCPVKAKAFSAHERYADYDERTDVWSLGILFYELLTGYQPFSSKSKSETCRLILSGKTRYPISIPDEHVCELKQIFTTEQQNRPYAIQLFGGIPEPEKKKVRMTLL